MHSEILLLLIDPRHQGLLREDLQAVLAERTDLPSGGLRAHPPRVLHPRRPLCLGCQSRRSPGLLLPLGFSLTRCLFPRRHLWRGLALYRGPDWTVNRRHLRLYQGRAPVAQVLHWEHQETAQGNPRAKTPGSPPLP